jgi:hypothetical protein
MRVIVLLLFSEIDTPKAPRENKTFYKETMKKGIQEIFLFPDS